MPNTLSPAWRTSAGPWAWCCLLLFPLAPTAFAVLASLLLLHAARGERPAPAGPSFVPGLALLAAGTTVGVVFSLDPARSLQTVVKALPGVLLAYAFFRAARTSSLPGADSFVRAMRPLLLLAFLVWLGSELYYGGYVIRVGGFVPAVSRNAQAVTLMVLLAAMLSCRLGPAVPRAAVIGGSIVLLWLVFATGGRGALLGALAVAALAAARGLGFRPRTIVLSALALGGSGALFVWLQYDALAAARGGNLLTGRDFLWRAAIHVISDFPLTGIGINTWKYSAYVDALAAPWKHEAGPHNIVLDVLTATGFAGALLTMAGLASWLRAMAARGIVIDGPLREFGLLLLVALLVNGMVDFRVWSVQFIGLTGVALVLWRAGSSKREGVAR